MWTKIKTFFQKLGKILSQNLSRRFMLASLMILLVGMAGIGAWVEKQIETGVVHRTGATTALYVDSFIAPYLQGITENQNLLSEQSEPLSRLLQDTPMGQQIVAFKLWDTRGRLLYTTDQTSIGKTYPMREGLLRARLGEVVTELSPLEDEENAPLAAKFDKLLETYSPVRLGGTNQVIAVAEFYQRTDELDQETGILKRQSWFVVGVTLLFIYLLLSVFVRRASSTITHQQLELEQQVHQLTGLLAQNQELHERVRRASASVALLNESYLRRIGSELHDGPAQELGLSLLKLDVLAGQVEIQQPQEAGQANLDRLTEIQSSLQSALKEMRGIAAGLSIPQLSELSLPETVTRAVRAHERRTGTAVELKLDNVPEQSSLPVKITVYRLVQEALNNAFRHAGGAGQQVQVSREQAQLLVEISDQGPGFDPDQAASQDGRLGLRGMRERVESLGGRFTIRSASGQGTTILASLPVSEEGDVLL
jgi:signal transduction histidine kinase